MDLILSTNLKAKLTSKIITTNGVTFKVNAPILNVDAPRFGNYFGVTSQGIVKYHAKPTNQVILENGNWSPEGRQEIKIGKLISYLFEQNPPVIESSSAVNPQNAITRYIESVTHSIKATPSIEIKITNDINKIYKMPVSAFLRSQSCMVGRSFDFNVIYDQLRKRGVKVSILYTTEVIKKVETLTSRAIIWHNVKAKSNIMKRLKLTNTFTLIDRIYGGDKYEQLYKEYAIANGYFHKVQQSCHHHSIINPVSNISLISKDYYIFLRNNKKMEFGITVAPYMDTFFGMYGTVLNGTGTLEHLVAQFRNTNGHPRMYDFRRYA